MMQAAILAIAMTLATSTGPSKTVDVLGPVKVGEPMPSFAGWTTDGKMLSLARAIDGEKDTPKSPVVVTFFATWCKPCDHGLPILDRVTAAHGAKLVMVAYGQEADVVRPYLEQKGIAKTCILDPYLKVAHRSGVDEALPRTFVLDERGVVRAIFTLEGDDFETALARAIDDAKAAPKTAPVEATAPRSAPEKRPAPTKGKAARPGTR